MGRRPRYLCCIMVRGLPTSQMPLQSTRTPSSQLPTSELQDGSGSWGVIHDFGMVRYAPPPDQVLAVFPDTTSFYRGIISKQPARKGGTVSEVRLIPSLGGACVPEVACWREFDAPVPEGTEASRVCGGACDRAS